MPPAATTSIGRFPPSARLGDACGTAHALDLIGERWALLVMRELLLGPKRYSDLKTDLPGVSDSAPLSTPAHRCSGVSSTSSTARSIRSSARRPEERVLVGTGAQLVHELTAFSFVVDIPAQAA